ncbi:MAG: hypothetical protein O3A25_09700 [Acidobacteria bacterium]|nr:hypothetical protein [Acidobacteriota bacterium]
MTPRLPIVVLVACLLAVGVAHAQDPDELFPNTKSRGRAAVEYRDDAIQAVAAYYYSQREHESRWLLIEVALVSEERMSLPRTAFRLVSPDGQEIAVAEQSQFAEDSTRTTPLLQNARSTRHNVTSYFRQQRWEDLRFFTVPFGPVVQDEFVIDKTRVVSGDLFFVAPTGAWADGTYALVVEHEGTRASLPIVLE